MIKDEIKKSRGITLVTLSVAIVIMVIITSVLVFNINTGAETRRLNNMYADITLLKDKIDLFYLSYGKLPIIETPYTKVDSITGINANDNQVYYVIDLQALDNIRLSYGKGIEEYRKDPNTENQDLYILNEQSHTVYYVKGIDFDKKTYYTMSAESTKVNAEARNCNVPKLAEGMIPVKWDGAQMVETKTYDPEWYDYLDTSISGKENMSKWANAQTKDGSMWVWIPRYAYKIIYTNANDSSQGGTIEVVFLKGTTNLDFNGNDVTKEDYVDEKGNVGAYLIHPAFQSGVNNNFANGEWDKEITGFWMAKFEAGYENADKAVDSTVSYSVIYGNENGTYHEITNSYYGERTIGTTIKYPTFKANRPSMNFLGISDAYDLVKNLTQEDNPYGLKGGDSHLTKNSEWGAVAYLTNSKYGRNKEKVTINNVTANGENMVWAITGYGATNVSGAQDATRSLAVLTTENQEGSWTTLQGQKASTTGNVYGIYDLAGGTWEWAAGYVATGNYETYAGSLQGASNLYRSKYAGISSMDTENYNESLNKTRLGEAIWETSTTSGVTSWNAEASYFPYTNLPFFVRGGDWNTKTIAGIFAFGRNSGACIYNDGFRAVLVTE